MKRTALHIIIGSIVSAVVLVGCSSETEATAEDKSNLDRLHKEGIGKVMADDMAKQGKTPPPDVSLANPTGGPGPADP